MKQTKRTPSWQKRFLPVRGRLTLIVFAYIAFISLGLPDGLLGVAWPSMRADFERSLDSLGILLLVSMLGYLASSFFSGWAIARLGIGGLLAASCAATGLGLLGYTLAPMWWMVVILALVAGLGAGAIDAGLNTYIASHFGEGFMQWLHASYGVGVTLGPIIMTTGLNVFHTWRLGYQVVGVAQLLLALSFLLTMSLWQSKPQSSGGPSAEFAKRLTDYRTPLLETLGQPRVWLSLLLFFIYTGVEVTLGSWAYSLLTEARDIAPRVAGLWAGSYWGTFTLGRILAGLYTWRINGHALIRFSVLAALAGAVLLWWNPMPTFGLLGVALVGFAIAPIFPGLVSGTGNRVGMQHAANTIGMQMTAAGLGGASLSGLAGVLAQRISLEIIPLYMTFWLLLLFFFYNFSSRSSSKNSDA